MLESNSQTYSNYTQNKLVSSLKHALNILKYFAKGCLIQMMNDHFDRIIPAVIIFIILILVLYFKFLDKSTGFDWVKKNRLPFFLKSELFAEYKLARTLSVAQVNSVFLCQLFCFKIRTYHFNDQKRMAWDTLEKMV